MTSDILNIDCSRLLRQVSARWNIATEIQHVQDSENFVYRVRYGADTAFLRITPPSHRSRKQIEAELYFVEFLAANGVRVAHPIASADGLLVESVQEGSIIFYACLFAAAPGNRFSLRSISNDGETIRQWGRLMGMIHACASRYCPADARRYKWDTDDVWARAEVYLPATEVTARRELQELHQWLMQQGECENTFGLLHGDLCLANFHVEHTIPMAFDFDDSCYHWFLYDIVCALAPNIGRPAEERRAIRELFLEGYETEYKLTSGWEVAFDQFLRLRGLYLFILNHRNWLGDMADHPKRDFLDLLRASFDHPTRW